MRRKTITLFLAVIIVIMNGISGSAASLGQEAKTSNESEYSYKDILAGIINPYDYYDKIDPSSVSDAVGYETAIGRTHIERLYDEEEHLYDVAFLNADHTKTFYYFDYPVKYIDRNGKFEDISLEIETSERNEFAYISKDSRAQSKFPYNLTDGITLDGDNLSITMIPIVNDSVKSESTESNDVFAERLSSKTIAYKKDDKTSYEYSLTYAGFKEDIVVKEYTGQTEYNFLLRTNGLKVKEIQDSYFIVDDNDNIKATIGDVIIITADENNNALGKLLCETICDKYEYLLTIYIEEEYLTDEKTIYPIRIDPTIEIKYESNGDGAIEDVTINSLDTSAGSSGSLFVGLRNTYGISRILMRFPQLNLNSINASEDIITATVEMKDLLCETDAMYVDCHPFTGNFWTESNVDWSTVSPNSYGNRTAHVSVSYSNGNSLTPKHRYSFDITAIVKGWKLGNYDKTRGIIFKAPNNVEAGPTKINKTFASYNRATNKPTLTITYENDDFPVLEDSVYFANNDYYGKYLKYNYQSQVASASVASGLLSSLGSNIKWRINRVDGGYVIRSTNNLSRYLAVPENTNSSSVDIVYVSDASIPDRCIWDIYSSGHGGLFVRSNYNYRFLNSNGSTLSTASSYGIPESQQFWKCVWRIVDRNDYGNTSNNAYRELNSYFTVDTLVLNEEQSKAPTINKSPLNSLWADVDDFNYTYSSGTNGSVSFNGDTGIASGLNIGITTYTATHKVTGLSYSFDIYVDLYTYKLVDFFEFDADAALLIRDVYNRIDNAYSSSTEKHKAWITSRLLSECVYDGYTPFLNIFHIYKWDDVAGSVTSSDQNRQSFFVNTLGFTTTQYGTINSSIWNKHDNSNSDFAHMQYSLAARLAYSLQLDGVLSNIYTGNNDEYVSYLAGWLGDAVLIQGTTTIFGNDDYMADLDAENIFCIIEEDDDGLTPAIGIINQYYNTISNINNNRAVVFKTNIDFAYVRDTILNTLDMSLVDVQGNHPDTYDFIMSLDEDCAEMVDY